MTQDKTLQEFEETALMGAKAVRAFLTYQGSNKDYFAKARVGAVAMSSYGRLRATMANEAALRLAADKRETPVIETQPLKRIAGGK